MRAAISPRDASSVAPDAPPDELAGIEAGTFLLAVAATGGDIATVPRPGFPTDMQAQFMAVMTLAQGTSVVTESVFENRYMHVPELSRMGADIEVHGRVAVVKGVAALSGASVMATDLRASACVVVAGLTSADRTEGLRVDHLDRGDESIEKKLRPLAARIERVRGDG